MAPEVATPDTMQGVLEQKERHRQGNQRVADQSDACATDKRCTRNLIRSDRYDCSNLLARCLRYFSRRF
jgi:hypothetical protein